MSNLGDTDAIFSYERLLLNQPQLKTYGIYKSRNRYYIKCESLQALPINSEYQNIVDSFHNEIRTIGCPIELVTELPNESIKLEERYTSDIINLSGNPLNIFDFNKQLSLLLSAELPKLWVEFNHLIKGWNVFLERKASKDEENIIKNKISMLCGYNVNVVFKIGLNLKNEYNDCNDLSLAVSRLSVFNYSKSIMTKWEQDEQIWSDNKVKLFSSPSVGSDDQKIPTRSACLINSLNYKAYNIRNYLTLFSEVILVVPPGDKIEELLYYLDLTQKELLKLLEINRIKLIFPHSITRYNKEFLENTASIAPSNLTFSRELAYKTVNDLKCRNPLFFLPLSIEEKKEVLFELLDLASKQDEKNKWINSLVNELSRSWSNMYEMLAIRGALGTFNVGLGPIINTMMKTFTGRDYFLEIMQADNSIEWAAANQAVLCPVGPLAQNEIQLAYLYSGVRENWDFELVTQPNIATGEILTIARHIPVEELAVAFTGTEIDQFRKVLVDITQNKTPEELRKAIQAFNQSVKSFEKNRKRIETWDVQGIYLDAFLEVSNLAIPFSGFIVKRLGNLINDLGDRYKFIDKILRQIEAKAHRTSPNVVLVSRMRDKVKDLL